MSTEDVANCAPSLPHVRESVGDLEAVMRSEMDKVRNCTQNSKRRVVAHAQRERERQRER